MAKRKTRRNLQPHEKGFAKAIIWAMCLAVVITILSLPREITLGQEQITIRHRDIYRGGRHGRSNRYLWINSTEGKLYTIPDAQIPLLELEELLVPGTKVELEYFEDWLIRLSPGGARPVTKLVLDGELLVLREPGDNTENRVLLWICPVILLFGFLRWASGEHLLRKWKKKRKKERKRSKKEGLKK